MVLSPLLEASFPQVFPFSLFPFFPFSLFSLSFPFSPFLLSKIHSFDSVPHFSLLILQIEEHAKSLKMGIVGCYFGNEVISFLSISFIFILLTFAFLSLRQGMRLNYLLFLNLLDK